MQMCAPVYLCEGSQNYARWSQAGPIAWASSVPPAELGVAPLLSPWAYTENVQVKSQASSPTEAGLRNYRLTPV